MGDGRRGGMRALGEANVRSGRRSRIGSVAVAGKPGMSVVVVVGSVVSLRIWLVVAPEPIELEGTGTAETSGERRFASLGGMAGTSAGLLCRSGARDAAHATMRLLFLVSPYERTILIISRIKELAKVAEFGVIVCLFEQGDEFGERMYGIDSAGMVEQKGQRIDGVRKVASMNGIQLGVGTDTKRFYFLERVGAVINISDVRYRGIVESWRRFKMQCESQSEELMQSHCG